MNKKYDHLVVEKNINAKWIKKCFFSKHNLEKKPFTIVLPPPNITGKLHLGHALDSYLQDTVIRYKKLKGYDVLFIPSTDHAGIATQSKIEQFFRENKIDKSALTKEELFKYAETWKNKYQDNIKKQWYKLGLALDYTNQRFTMDLGAKEAVKKVFIDLYNKGLIYRGARAINWDPQLQTVISNIEVINKPLKSWMYFIKYQIINSHDFLVVATTRPETIFSDVALAIHPENKKMKKYISKKAINPLTNEPLPIILDSHAEIKKGSGVMKVSAHSIIDFDIIKANQLEIKECIDKDGKMNNLAKDLAGLPLMVAREKVETILQEKKLLLKKERIKSNIGFSQRSGTMIEILVQPQWFVKMQDLANLVIKNLNSPESVNFFPTKFKKELMRWLMNIKDWTISRQLWFGHRIPAWYNGNKILVQEKSPGKNWKQDKDVLDTWFSSGLIPLVFLDWPNCRDKFLRYFPTDLLVTGYDIIFFWIARMYFQSLFFTSSIPFKNVLIHGLVRDAKGKKMSKSLGNGIDPIKIIEQFGSDSLRWFLITSSASGQDIRFSFEKLKGAWSLNNKLWNIARFITTLDLQKSKKTSTKKSIFDLWIEKHLWKLEKKISEKITKYRFNLIGKDILDFIENKLSSWYIEFLKMEFNKKQVLSIFKKILIVLHPFLPFITDYLFKLLYNEELLDNSWPEINNKEQVKTSRVDFLILIIKTIRSFREDKNISKKITLNYWIKNQLTMLEKEVIFKLANAQFKTNIMEKEVLPLEKQELIIEKDEKILKLIKNNAGEELQKIYQEINRCIQMIENSNFIKKAPKWKIEEEKNKLKKYKKQLKIIKEKYKNI